MLSNLNEEYKKKLDIIRKHFGEEHQYRKLIEEMKEFSVELTAVYLNDNEEFTDIFKDSIFQNNEAIKKLLEEMVDCYVVAYQINEISFLKDILYLMVNHDYLDFGLKILHILENKKECLEIAKQKIDRTLERLESGYYPNSNIVTCPACGGAGEEETVYGDYALCSCGGTGRKEK